MIQDRSMLIDLTISQWTATRYDKSVSAEVEKQHAATDAGRYNKRLIDKAHLATIAAAAAKVRSYHYARTMPWTDKGQRLLPSALFMDYAAEMRRLKEAFVREVDEFIVKYPQLLQDARKRLNTMYSDGDYPTPTELRKMFDITYDVMPVPAAGDFRVDLTNEVQENLRAQITEAIAIRQKGLIADCWVRVGELAKRVHDQCASKTPIIREGLVKDMNELPSILDALNLMNDPALAAASAEMRAGFAVEAEQLRKRASVRMRAAESADKLLQMVPR